MIKLCWAPLHSIENGKEKHTVQRPETDFQLFGAALIDFSLAQHTIGFLIFGEGIYSTCLYIQFGIYVILVESILEVIQRRAVTDIQSPTMASEKWL